MSVLFRCDRLSSNLPVSTCLVQHAAATAQARTARPGQQVSKCAGCDVGAAHARGEPTPQALLRLVQDTSRVCEVCKKPIPRDRSDVAVTCSVDCFSKLTKPAPAVENKPAVPARACEQCKGPIPPTCSKTAMTCSEDCHEARKLALSRHRHVVTAGPMLGRYKPKACKACGETFDPIANNNTYCPKCKRGARPTKAPKNQPLMTADLPPAEFELKSDPPKRRQLTWDCQECGKTQPPGVAETFCDECRQSIADEYRFSNDQSAEVAPPVVLPPPRVEVRTPTRAPDIVDFAHAMGMPKVTSRVATPTELLIAAGYKVAGTMRVPSGYVIMVTTEGMTE